MHGTLCSDRVHRVNDTLKNSGAVLTIGARDELRLRVLRALEDNPKLSQRQLATELGVSLGGVNYAIKTLVASGFLKVKDFSRSDNKPAYLYILTPSGIAEKIQVAAALLSRRLEEYEELKREIDDLKYEIQLSEGAKR